MKVFPASLIGLDAQGGGIAIEEALHDPNNLQDGENLILPIIDPNKRKETERYFRKTVLIILRHAFNIKPWFRFA